MTSPKISSGVNTVRDVCVEIIRLLDYHYQVDLQKEEEMKKRQ